MEPDLSNNLPVEVQRTLIQQKLTMWRNTVYDAQLDAKIAKALEDERGEQQARQRIKSALKAVELLEQMMNELARLEAE